MKAATTSKSAKVAPNGNSGPKNGSSKGSKELKVTCETAESLPLNQIVEFQGELKTLSRKEFDKLKASLVRYGVSFPSYIWKSKQGLKCLDGHQRSRVLKEMQKEGWKIPAIPVVYVEAKNEKEAKEKILILSSQYGKYTMDSVYEFISESDLNFEMLDDAVELPQFNWEKFKMGYLDDGNFPDESRSRFTTERKIVELKPHPLNYRTHPDDQIEHLMASIKENGIFRDVVIARDGTILAGHGITEAARRLNIETVPVKQLDLDPMDPRALKVLTGDNETGKTANVDDRRLADLLKGLMESAGLPGTGFDDQQLAALAFVTRAEMKDKDTADHWVGMPEYADGETICQIAVNFLNEQDREKFLTEIKMTKAREWGNGKTWTCWWPPREKDDLLSVKFEEANGAKT